MKQVQSSSQSSEARLGSFSSILPNKQKSLYQDTDDVTPETR